MDGAAILWDMALTPLLGTAECSASGLAGVAAGAVVGVAAGGLACNLEEVGAGVEALGQVGGGKVQLTLPAVPLKRDRCFLFGDIKEADEMMITILSGKGGTGKTTVATNLAWVLSLNWKVQLLDADVEEPDDHLFLPPQIEETDSVEILLPRVDQKACTKCGECAKVCQFGAISVFKTGVMVFDSLCHGCGACTLACPEEAITEVPKVIGEVKSGKVCKRIDFSMGILNVGEPSGVRVIRKLKEKIDPSADVVIVDASPGTSCPVVEALRNADFALLVTEPTPFGLHDLQMAVGLASEMGVKAGIVVNRDSEGFEGVDRFSKESGVPILMRIPYDPQIAELYSKGILFSSRFPQWKVEFDRLFEKIREMVEP